MHLQILNYFAGNADKKINVFHSQKLLETVWCRTKTQVVNVLLAQCEKYESFTALSTTVLVKLEIMYNFPDKICFN